MTAIHRSHQTEHLVRQLGAFLSTPSNPLVPDLVLVHSHGLGTWLEQQLAHALGLCANVRFIQPMELVQRVRSGAGGWSRQTLVWTLLDLLLTHRDDPALAEVRTWSLTDGAAYQTRRLADLALDLAPRFERYALYRPEETRAWDLDGDWQAVLWSHLVARLPMPFDADAKGGDSPALAGRLAVFCPGILPPQVLELLAEVGQKTPLQFFVLRPTCLSGHPLLHSLGGQAAAFDRLLAQHLPDAPRRDFFPAPSAAGVLGTIQRDLHHGTVSAPSAGGPGAPSVRVHRCGGAQRQVEVLRDVLFEAFEDASLEPRDVLVMTPDVNRFGPLIRAALRMDRGPNSPTIPMRLADTSLQVRNTAAGALLDALDLLQGRFEVTRIFDLLGRPEVVEKWGTNADTLSAMGEMAGAAAIHWGMDVAHKVSLDLPATENYSWRHGLDRLLLGLAMPTDDLLLGLSPVGQPKARSGVVGILVEFVQGLVECRELLAGEFTADGWHTNVLLVLDHLCGQGGWTVRAVRNAISEVVDAGEACQTPLGLAAFTRLLEGRFGLTEPGQQYLAGGVTVCAMVPMRSIPFRAVCLMGMDEDAYPRQGTRPIYDIMVDDLRDGDVNSRQDDRALLLETLLSARDRLEIFTTARSPRDGQQRPPAVPVAELLDVLEEASPGLAAAVTVDHPLQPYAAGPFVQAARSFDPVFCEAARAAVVGRTAITGPHRFLDAPLDLPETLTEVALFRLISCLKNPIKYFCTRVLGLYLEDRETELTDVEPLDLGHWGDYLVRWKTKKEIIAILLEGGDPLEILRARGEIPAGTLGQMLVDGLVGPCRDQADEILTWWKQPVPHRVDVEIDGIRIYGAVPLREGRVVDWTPSGRGDRHNLGAWVQGLALCASGAAVDGVVVCHGGETWRATPLAAGEARDALAGYVGIFKDANRAPLPFRDRFAEAYKREDWDPDVYERWVLGGQRMDTPPLAGIPQLPGRSFDELDQLILGGLP